MDAIIVVDSAEQLFASWTNSRGQVNSELNILLYHIAKFNGLIVFIVNSPDKGRIDLTMLPNVNMQFILEFPMPHVQLRYHGSFSLNSFINRKDLWKQLIPEKTPAEEINFNKLAEFEFSGGTIS